MAKGKYANSAEARRTREGALSEVEAGRRTIVRLTTENRELRATLAKEREESAERNRRLVALLNADSAPELERLRAELEMAKRRLREDRIEVGHAVGKVLANTETRYKGERKPGGDFLIDMAEALRVQVGDLVTAATHAPRREARRRTNTQARRNLMIKEWARSRGQWEPE